MNVEPSDVVVFLGSDVCGRTFPIVHQPGAKEHRLSRGYDSQSAQVRRQSGRYLHAEFFAQSTRERVKL